MAGTQTAKMIDVALPAAGQEATYLIEPGEELKFDFDTANAIFAQSGNDLVIEVEGQGTIVLDNYMDVAAGNNPPVIIQADGVQVPGNVFLASIQADLQPAAGGENPSGGAGEYNDDPSSLFDPLQHLGGQADPGRPSPEPFVDPVRGVEQDTETGGEPVEAQIVLNPSFEHANALVADYSGEGTWGTTTPPANWQAMGNQTTIAQSTATADGYWAMQQAGYFATEDDTKNVGLYGHDGTTAAWLSQDIASQAGETLTISFNFAPNPLDNARNPEMNNFDVMLGDDVIGTMRYDAGTGSYDFTVGGEVLYTIPYLINNTVIIEWTEISFEVTASADHATLSFVDDFTSGDTSTLGPFVDNVTAIRQFDTIIEDTSAGNNVTGTDGDDFILGTDRDHIDSDSLGSHTDGGDTIHAGAGHDAVYGGNGDDTFYGEAGNDFLHGGAGNDHLIGGEGNDYLRGSEGNDVMEGGTGNDIFDAGSGDTLTLGEGNDIVKLSYSSLEPAANDANIIVNDYAGGSDELHLQTGLNITGISYDATGALVTVASGGEDVVVHLLGVTQASLNAAAAAAPADTTDDVLQYIIANSAP